MLKAGLEFNPIVFFFSDTQVGANLGFVMPCAIDWNAEEKKISKSYNTKYLWRNDLWRQPKQSLFLY